MDEFCDGSVSEGDFCGDVIECRRCRPRASADDAPRATIPQPTRTDDYPTSQEGPGQGPAIACARKDVRVGDCVVVGDDSEEGIILELDTLRCRMVATIKLNTGMCILDIPLSRLRRRVHDPPGGALRADAHEMIIEEQSATAVAASSSSSRPQANPPPFELFSQWCLRTIVPRLPPGPPPWLRFRNEASEALGNTATSHAIGSKAYALWTQHRCRTERKAAEHKVADRAHKRKHEHEDRSRSPIRRRRAA